MLAVIIPVLTIPMAWIDNYISCNKTVCGRKLDLLTLKKNIDSSRLRLRLFVPLWKAVCLFVFLYLWAPDYINRDCSDKSGLLLLQLLHPFHKSSLCVNTITTLLFLAGYILRFFHLCASSYLRSSLENFMPWLGHNSQLLEAACYFYCSALQLHMEIQSNRSALEEQLTLDERTQNLAMTTPSPEHMTWEEREILFNDSKWLPPKLRKQPNMVCVPSAKDGIEAIRNFVRYLHEGVL